MKKASLAVLQLATAAALAVAQDTPPPGDWKTWVIRSAKDHNVPPPSDAGATRSELDWLRGFAAESDPRIAAQIRFWDSGPPSYRWMELVAKRQIDGRPLGTYFVRASTCVSLAIYDATLAAAQAKQEYQRKCSPTCSRIARTTSAPSARKRETRASGPAFTSRWTTAPASRWAATSRGSSLTGPRTTDRGGKSAPKRLL